MKTFFLISFLSLVLHMQAQTVRKLDDLTMGQVDAIINAEMLVNGLPGVNVGLVYNGRVAYTKAFGLASVGVNATTSTKYPIASVSKTITAMMAMRMIADGDLGLNTTIDNYVPFYSGTNITIRHLLCHQSGIGHYADCGSGYNGTFNAISSQFVLQTCSRCMTPPGSGTIYSTFGTTLLGCIIDVVGQSVYNKGYIALYNERIKNVAGLTNLTAESGNSIPGLAQGYNSDGDPVFGSWNDMGWKLPAGGFVSTAHDLAAFGAGVMNYSFLNSTISNNTMWVKQTTSGNPVNMCQSSLSSPYGLGFVVSSSGDDLRISHNGLNDHGYSSFLYLYPPQKAGTVLLTNRYEETSELGVINNNIEGLLLCPSDRDFTSPINWGGNWIYEATNSISASNAITTTNSSFVFDAGTAVILKPGFEALSGSEFRALVEGCGGLIKPY